MERARALRKTGRSGFRKPAQPEVTRTYTPYVAPKPKTFLGKVRQLFGKIVGHK